MSRFEQEFALVPTGARWTAVLVVLAFATLMAGIFLVPVALTEPKSLPFVLPGLPRFPPGRRVPRGVRAARRLRLRRTRSGAG